MLRDLVSRVRNGTFLGKIRDQPPRIWIFGPNLLHWWSRLLMRIKLPTLLSWISKYAVLVINGFYSTKVKKTKYLKYGLYSHDNDKLFQNQAIESSVFLLLSVNINSVILWIFSFSLIQSDYLDMETNISHKFIFIWCRKISSFHWFLSLS